MIPPPVFLSDSVSAHAFTRRVALSALALEIDELLHRCGGTVFVSPSATPPDSSPRHSATIHPQTTHTP
ncbi:MAG: hypothetical protein H7067_03310 [Burkholderiales bacterium]|nr:hypothetical protein [Opitutaceae bacterium]